MSFAFHRDNYAAGDGASGQLPQAGHTEPPSIKPAVNPPYQLLQ
jgi:hypothetical protein